MKTCNQCGSAVADGYRICPKCGGKHFGAASPVPVPQPGGKVSSPPVRKKLLKPFMQVVLLSRWAIASILAGVVVFFGLLYLSTGWLADTTARSASLEQVSQTLAEVMEKAELRKMVDAALPETHFYSRLTRRIGEDLVAALPNPTGYPYRFLVIPTDQINAMALPGGLVIVFSGMIETLNNPEQLAAVLAHEIQHVEHRHGMRQHYRTLGTLALTGVLFGVAQDSGTVLTANLLSMKYSREFETEADLEGARLMAHAGISPKAMVSMLEKLEEIESGWMPSILRSHPKSGLRAKRVAALPELQSDLPESNPNWNN